VAVVVAVGVAVAVFLVVKRDDQDAAPHYCPPARLSLYFRTDDQMRAAEAELKRDSQFTEVSTETKSEAYEHYQKIFANEPELLKLARPDSLPANIHLSLVDGADKERLSEELPKRFPADRVQDDCVYNDRAKEVAGN
jgi:cell division protein FtsX